MEYLDIILQEEEGNIVKQKFDQFSDLYNDVKRFIIQHKRILYGGTALNEILPVEKKFYKEYQLPDFDVFTPTPKQDALALAKYLKKKGYKYIEIKRGFWHKGTFKVYAEFQPVVDFTFVRRTFYEFLLEQTKEHPKRNQSDPRYKIAFPILLMWSLYRELSRPKGSLYRLKKVFTRFKTFRKEFGLKAEITNFPLDKIPDETKPYLDIVRKYVKTNQIPIVGGFAIGLHLGANRWNSINCCSIPGLPMFDILSQNMEETLEVLKELLPDMIVKKRESTHLNEIMPSRYLLRTNTEEPITFARIFDASDGCFSINTICGYKVGNLDTILNYLYAQLIADMFFENTVHNTPAAKFTSTIINTLEKENSKKPLRERFDLTCWGKEKSKEDVLKEKWRNPTKIKISFI